jgi:hypothetical protein
MKFLFDEGQVDDEAAAGLVRSIERDIATEVLEMTLGEWQAYAKAFGKVVDFGKHLEQAADVFLGDARTGILDNEIHLVVCTIDAHRDVLTIGKL